MNVAITSPNWSLFWKNIAFTEVTVHAWLILIKSGLLTNGTFSLPTTKQPT